MARGFIGRAKHAAPPHGGGPRVHVRKNDQVKVITGKDVDKVARVLAVYPTTGLAIVEGVNFVKRHTRPNPQRNIKGGIAEKESPIHVSNLMVVCPECKEASRLGRLVLDDGTRVRVCKKCKGQVDKSD